MKRRKAGLLSFGLIIGLLLAGCGGGSSTTANGNSGSSGNPTPTPAEPVTFNGVGHGAGVFIGAGNDGNGKAIIETSTDGISWQMQNANYAKPIGAFPLFAVGSAGILARYDFSNVFFSSNGTAWTNTTPAAVGAGVINGITWDGSQYLLVSSTSSAPGATVAVYTSTDGSNWSSLSQPGTIHGLYILKTASGWTAIDDNGNIATSTDLQNWIEPSNPTIPAGAPNQLSPYGVNKFVVVGTGGLIAVSSDGATFTNVSNSSVTTQDLNDVVWNGSVCVAVGNAATVLYSTNCATWVSVDVSALVSGGAASKLNFTAVTAAANGAFVAVGSGSSVSPLEITSADGLHWSAGKP